MKRKIIGLLVADEAEVIDVSLKGRGEKIYSHFVWKPEELVNLTLSQKLTIIDVLNVAQRRIIGLVSGESLLKHLRKIRENKDE